MNTSSSPCFFETIGIVGVGLIGGSIGLAFKEAGLVGKVLGSGRSASNLEIALQRGQIDEIVDCFEYRGIYSVSITIIRVHKAGKLQLSTSVVDNTVLFYEFITLSHYK